MRFAWNRATDDDPMADVPGSAPDVDDTGFAPVLILLAETGEHVGWIDTGGQRTSDWLNGREQVPVRELAAGDVPPVQPPEATSSPVDVDPHAIVWVVPPPLPPNRHLRLHRRRVLVHLELDDYEVSGQAHVRPGADAIDQVLRGTRDLVPLTDVQVVSKANPGHGSLLPVLIVNRRYVRRVVEDSPHTSAPVPDPQLPDGELDPRIALLVPPVASAPVAEAPDVPEATAPAEPSGVDLLLAALTLLLEAGIIDVVEFQSIRARIPTPTPG